ncbi:MAG: hypothetical protein P1P80_02090 [ANME-2 cluster archaeon]|nr:hypothetical protein [ANME-2 cluster archaeon]
MVEDILYYETSLRWDREKIGTVTFPQEGKTPIVVAKPPEFGGHEGIITPEDMFVLFTKIVLRPRVEAIGSEEQILRMLDQAKKRCIAANSMKTEVVIEPTAISVQN